MKTLRQEILQFLREVERLTSWLMSKEPWLKPHIDGYVQSIADKINRALSSDTK